MILRKLSATVDNWKFAARAMDQQGGSFDFLFGLLQDIGFEVILDEYDGFSALIFAPGVAAPVGEMYGASEAMVHIWAEDEPICIPCPEPSDCLTIAESMALPVEDPRTADHGWRRGLEAAGLGQEQAYGFTAWGRAFEAGFNYGKQFTL